MFMVMDMKQGNEAPWLMGCSRIDTPSGKTLKLAKESREDMISFDHG
jgi:hypothetical protein